MITGSLKRWKSFLFQGTLCAMKKRTRPAALTIAGSDPSGGAGIQADLKTFHQAGVYGMSVVTLVTVQNTCSVRDVHILSADLVRRQLEAVLTDIPPAAAKTGALGSREVIQLIAKAARDFRFPLVVDPVMISKHGAPLMQENACEALITELLPQAFLVTPNLPEAVRLTGISCESAASFDPMARKIASFGPKAVLIKGGHFEGEAADYLYENGHGQFFRAERVATRHTHGTGCTFSAAITAGLALGWNLTESVERAKHFVTLAIQQAPGLGSGAGPVDHFAPF